MKKKKYDLLLKIVRKESSYNYVYNKHKPMSFSNNWYNNTKDDMLLLADGKEIFSCKVQTVANYCFGGFETKGSVPHGGTISTGKFKLKCFVPPRAFKGEIHAITETKDILGRYIDKYAMHTTKSGFQNGRWLIHSRFSPKLGKDTNYGWSGGCFISNTADLELFADVLKSYGVKRGDIIDGVVEEVIA